MAKMLKVIVEIVKEDEDGNEVGRPKRMAYWLGDGVESIDYMDARDWFEDSYPVDGVDTSNDRKTFIGYRITDTGFVRYTMKIVAEK